YVSAGSNPKEVERLPTNISNDRWHMANRRDSRIANDQFAGERWSQCQEEIPEWLEGWAVPWPDAFLSGASYERVGDVFGRKEGEGASFGHVAWRRVALTFHAFEVLLKAF